MRRRGLRLLLTACAWLAAAPATAQAVVDSGEIDTLRRLIEGVSTRAKASATS